MTERERLALFEAAGLDKIVSQDFKTYLLTNGFFAPRQAQNIMAHTKVVFWIIPSW